MSDSVAPPRLADLEHPWLGLESFREDTRDYFFGRNAEIAEIHLRVRAQPLLIVYGRSGLGKTSILRAGVIPRLQKDGHRPLVLRLSYKSEAPAVVVPKSGSIRAMIVGDAPASARVDLPPRHPASQIYHALFDAPAQLRDSSPSPVLSEIDLSWRQQRASELPFALPDDPASLLWLRLHDRQTPPARTHLILDQFEEVFTLGAERPGADRDVREAVAILVQGTIPAPIAECLAINDALLDHFDPDSQPVRLILALRDDYVYALNRWRRHLPQLGQNFFELRPLRGKAAFDAIYQPARLRWHMIERDGKLIEAETGLPPLLTEETARRIARFIREKKRKASEPEDGDDDDEIEVQSPILSLLCRELNERRFTEPPGTRERPVPEVIFDDQNTNVETILQNFYERCLAETPEAVRIFIEEELVSYAGIRLQQDEVSMLDRFEKGMEIPDTNPVQMARGFDDWEKARACLRKLVSDRLLVALGDDAGGRYELTHDLLASVVRRSRTAREERLAKQHAEEQLKQAEHAAEERRKEALRDAEARLREAARAADEEKREAARLADEREKRQRQRTQRILSAALLLVLFVAGYAWVQRADAIVAAGKAESAAETAKAEAEEAKYARSEELRAKGEAQQALAVLKKQGAELQERLEQARLALEGQRATVAASRAALDQLEHFDQEFRARMTEAERRLLAEALTGLRSALSKAESGQLATTQLVATSEKSAQAFQATQKDQTAPQLLAVLSDHEKPIRALVFSPDSSQLASAGGDKYARLWGRSGEKGSSIESNSRDGINALAFSPDGRRIAIGSNGTTVLVRELISSARYQYSAHLDAITSVSFSPDSTRVLSSSADCTVRLWDLSNGSNFRIQRFNSIVTWAAFDLNGGRVLASLDEPANAAMLWNVNGLGAPLVLKMDAPVKRAVFSPDGRLALTAGSGDQNAAIWDVASGQRLQLLSGHTAAVWQAVFSPSGDRVATASGDRTVRLWSVADGKPTVVLSGHTGEVRRVLFSPDGASVLSGSDDATARLWTVDDPASSPQILSGHTEPLTAIAFSPDGTRIATGSKDGTVRLWEFAPARAGPTEESGWVLYGYLDRQAPKLRARSFSRVSGEPGALPAVGEVVRADAHMRIRSAVSLQPDGKWDQGRPIGLLRQGSQAKVLEVAGVEQRGESQMVWIKIGPP